MTNDGLRYMSKLQQGTITLSSKKIYDSQKKSTFFVISCVDYARTYLPAYLPTYLSTYLLSYLLTYLPTYFTTYLLTYLPTYFPTLLIIYVRQIIHREFKSWCLHTPQGSSMTHVMRTLFDLQLGMVDPTFQNKNLFRRQNLSRVTLPWRKFLCQVNHPR